MAHPAPWQTGCGGGPDDSPMISMGGLAGCAALVVTGKPAMIMNKPAVTSFPSMTGLLCASRAFYRALATSFLRITEIGPRRHPEIDRPDRFVIVATARRGECRKGRASGKSTQERARVSDPLRRVPG